LSAKAHLTGEPGRVWEEAAHNDEAVISEELKEADEMGRVVALMDDLFFQMNWRKPPKSLGWR